MLLVIVWHGVYNIVGGTAAAAGTLAAVISVLITVQGIALIAADVTTRHRGHPSILGPE